MTETRDDTVTWLTQEAYDRLKAELDHLSGPGRVDIAKKIEAARDEGDLKENGGYHAAKDEQGQIEARILLLMSILENARVGGPPRTDGVVGPGMTVTIRFVKDDDEVTFKGSARLWQQANSVAGPVIVLEATATTYVDDGFSVRADPSGVLLITQSGGGA